MADAISDSFVMNAHRLGESWRQRRRERRVAEALEGFEGDPEKTIARVRRIDPGAGLQLGQQYREEQRGIAATEREVASEDRERQSSAFNEVISLLSPVARDNPASLGATYDSLGPLLTGALGLSPEEVAQYRAMVVNNPELIRQAEEEIVRISGNGGAAIRIGRNGQPELLYQTPYRPEPAEIVTITNPESGAEEIHAVPRPRGPANEPSGSAARGTGGTSFRSSVPDMPRSEYVSEIERYVEGAGGRVSGRARTAERNREVGGVSNTYHSEEEDAGRDFQPPEGYTHQQWASHLSQQFPAYEFMAHRATLPNGSQGPLHVHGEPRPRGGYSREDNYQEPARSGGGSEGTMVYSTGPSRTQPGANVLAREEVVNLGLDPNVVWQRNEDGEISAIGGATAIRGAAARRTARYRYDTTVSQLSNLRETVDTLRQNRNGLERSVGPMSLIPSFPGSDAANFESQFETLKSQIAQQVLQTMRSMSQTGGAVGQVSNFEQRMFQENLAALDRAQSVPAMEEAFRRLDRWITRTEQRLQEAAEEDGLFNDSQGSQPASRRNGGGGQRQSQSGNRRPRANHAPTRTDMDALRNNPTARAQELFDQIYGQGASQRVLRGRRN